MSRSRRGLLALTLALSAGCGGGGGADPTLDHADPANHFPAEQCLGQIHDLLKVYLEQTGGRPPAQFRDLEPAEPAAPLGYEVLKRGDYALSYGAALDPAGAAKVLAYPKDAAEKGGTVLMQDGSMKRVTAAEFQAAPKAGR